MNLRRALYRRRATTWVEVMVVIVMLAIVAMLLLSALTPPKGTRAKRIDCVSKLKQIGLAARLWSIEHGERFPWQVSTNAGGTLEYATGSHVGRHFEAMSNELAEPKVLVCFADPGRASALNFTVPLANSNVSYFIGLDADERFHERWLFGDRNLTGGVATTFGLVYQSSSVPGWDGNIHNHQGNVGLADGSVQQTAANLPDHFRRAFATLTNAEMRLAIPRVPGE